MIPRRLASYALIGRETDPMSKGSRLRIQDGNTGMDEWKAIGERSGSCLPSLDYP